MALTDSADPQLLDRDVLLHRLREAEQRCEQLIEDAHDMIYTRDLSGHFTHVNRSCEPILGYSLAELLKMDIRQVLAPEYIELAQRMTHAKLAGAESSPYEVEIVRKDGQRRWLEISNHLLFRQGTPIAVQGIARDVTERKQVEVALRESEEKFRFMSAAAQDAIVMMDNDGRITFWSAAAGRIFGYPRSEAIGSLVHHLLAPVRYRDRCQKALSHWRETGQGAAVGKTVELVALRKDGVEFPIELSLSSVYLRGRWNAGTIVRDITDRKRADAELRETNAKLCAAVEKLEKKNALAGILSEMREFLLACSSAREVGPVVTRAMKHLYPDSEGALFLLSPSRTDLETAARWGGFPEEEQNVFAPDACWGLRKGSPYLVEDIESGLVCPHLKHPPAAGYACLPLMVKGDALGVLYLGARSAGPGEDARKWLADLREISSTVGEFLSLSIWNVRLRETLSSQSIKDPLTGLFNRRYMEETLQHEIYRAARKQHQIGILMADIDHFKDFNDLHGHAAGDAVLLELASFFKSRMRRTDVVCRYGGEEFTLLLPESSLEDSGQRAEQLRAEVRNLRANYAGQTLGLITLSVGVAAYPSNGTTPDELLRAADTALYRAKQEGRDRVALAGAASALDPRASDNQIPDLRPAPCSRT